ALTGTESLLHPGRCSDSILPDQNLYPLFFDYVLYYSTKDSHRLEENGIFSNIFILFYSIVRIYFFSRELFQDFQGKNSRWRDISEL
ncbi:hypothetical protein, partial [Acidaminococcus fermentans]|uniref:hypothetical protein n=1 Tax=Acidaminococcus fermentans TaxID=905 RepID=UPI00307A30EF